MLLFDKLFLNDFYLNSCDILNKYNIDNFHNIPSCKNIVLEINNSVLKKLGLKNDVEFFYISLLFYILSMRLPYVFIKKHKKKSNFKLKIHEKNIIYLILNYFSIEKSIILKKRLGSSIFLKNTMNLKYPAKLELYLYIPGLYADISDIFGNSITSGAEEIKLLVNTNINKKLELKLVSKSTEMLYRNLLWFWVYE